MPIAASARLSSLTALAASLVLSAAPVLGQAASPKKTAPTRTAATHRAPAKAAPCPAPLPPPEVPAGLPPATGQVKIQSVFALRYIDKQVGTGAEAVAGKSVSLHYTGWLASDGTKFDSSYDHPDKQPIQLILGAGRVIPGWDQGIVGMKQGREAAALHPLPARLRRQWTAAADPGEVRPDLRCRACGCKRRRCGRPNARISSAACSFSARARALGPPARSRDPGDPGRRGFSHLSRDSARSGKAGNAAHHAAVAQLQLRHIALEEHAGKEEDHRDPQRNQGPLALAMMNGERRHKPPDTRANKPDDVGVRAHANKYGRKQPRLTSAQRALRSTALPACRLLYFRSGPLPGGA